MELELVNHIPHLLLAFCAVFFPVIAFLALLFSSANKTVWASFGVIFVGLVVSATLVGNATTAEMNERFNKQLTEKYDSTSSRSFMNMKKDLQDSGEASTTLTRDGVETTVFFKVIKDGSRNLHTMKLALTVFDEGSLYPEAK